jgi:hypothetical protein
MRSDINSIQRKLTEIEDKYLKVKPTYNDEDIDEIININEM